MAFANCRKHLRRAKLIQIDEIGCAGAGVAWRDNARRLVSPKLCDADFPVDIVYILNPNFAAMRDFSACSPYEALIQMDIVRKFSHWHATCVDLCSCVRPDEKVNLNGEH